MLATLFAGMLIGIAVTDLWRRHFRRSDYAPAPRRRLPARDRPKLKQ